MSVHTIEDYVDSAGEQRWRIVVKPGTPGGTEGDIVADSGQGYKNRKDMLHSLFGLFFGTFDESFLTLYAEWNPNQALEAQQGPPPEEVSVETEVVGAVDDD